MRALLVYIHTDNWAWKPKLAIANQPQLFPSPGFPSLEEKFSNETLDGEVLNAVRSKKALYNPKTFLPTWDGEQTI